MSRAVEALGRDLTLLTRLALPVECPGCGELDVRCCPACVAVWTHGARRCEDAAPRLDRMDGRQVLPVWCLTDYRGPARDTVVAWKDRGRADLTRELGGAMAAASALVSSALVSSALVSSALGEAAGGALPRGVAVVPAPSSRAAARRRGREPVRELAQAVARGLVTGGVAARAVGALRQRGRTHDQVGLGARARAENLRGRVTTARAAETLGVPVLLVDDVLTTGATLAACEEALARARCVTLGALVLAATPAPSASSAGAAI